jgi:hypothetical protein
MPKLQSDRLHRFQLMKSDRDQVHVPFQRFLQGAHGISSPGLTQRSRVYFEIEAPVESRI